VNVKSASASESNVRLSSSIVAPADLDAWQRAAMFTVFARHYEAISRPRFESDLDEKDAVILLEDGSGAISGFSTQKILRATVGGREIRALFSGDTVIDRSQWGEQELVRGWCRFAGSVLQQEETPLYWFLISKGYRTYLYLPLFFREFFPRSGAEMPPCERSVLDTFASLKFGDHYDRRSGLISFPESLGQLANDVADVPLHRRDHEHVRFFLERNPDYAKGTELACLTEISLANLNDFGRRIFRSALQT
jgi:hypothetical protein